jgi:acyl carrier protein
MGMSTRAIVLECIRNKFSSHTGPVSDETKAEDVLGWDSFTHVQLIFDIEKKLGCEIDVSRTYDCENIGDLVAYLKALKPQSG